MNPTNPTSAVQGFLPLDDPLRAVLHNEVHARPPARIRLPALVLYVAVLNEGVGRDEKGRHMRRLPGHAAQDLEALQANFLRLRLGGHSLKWERHGEFTRYSLVQPAGGGRAGGRVHASVGQLVRSAVPTRV